VTTLPPVYPADYRGACRVVSCDRCRGARRVLERIPEISPRRTHRVIPCPRCAGLGVVRIPHPSYIARREVRDNLMAKARKALVAGDAGRAQAVKLIAGARRLTRELVAMKRRGRRT
jgi:hypothetical protein